MDEDWRTPYSRALRALSYLAAHALVAVAMIVLIELVQSVLAMFGEPRLFGILPIRYIFDFADLVLLVEFLVLGTREAVRQFRGGDHVDDA